MKRKVLLVVLLGLLVGPASYAANQQPSAVFTFICKGNVALLEGTCPQGGRPDSIIQGSDGNFYGAASVSQEGDSQPDGGTLFSLTPDGQFTLLHTFGPGPLKNYVNGDNPFGLIEAPDGDLYGTTADGGQTGNGVLFRVSKKGSGFKILHQFCSSTNCVDGGLGAISVVGADGNLYGTTFVGGSKLGACGANLGCGAIFRVTPSTGAYEVVFSFDSSAGFNGPDGLILASDGTLYGTQDTTLFHFTPSTGAFTAVALPFPLVNHMPSFPSACFNLTAPNCALPLLFGSNGNLYGLYTVYPDRGSGVFEVEPDGSGLQLFPYYRTPGFGTPVGFILASDGNFWITESNQGSGGDVVSVSPVDGELLQTEASFSSNDTTGAFPWAFIQAKDGTFWGTTISDGNAPKGHFGDGVAFSLNAGLPPR